MKKMTQNWWAKAAAVAAVCLSTQTAAVAQFTNKLETGCATWKEVQGAGQITYPASDFAVCAYTTQLWVKDKWVDLKVNEKTPQGGRYSFSYAAPAGSIGFPVRVRTVTNRQTASELTLTRFCGAVRFKNRYTPNQWINIEKGVAADNIQPGFLSAQWILVPIAGTKFVRLQSAWNPEAYLNIEKGPLEASTVPEGFFSGHWELEEVQETKAPNAPTYYRLKNRWKPEIYLNTEKGKLEASAVPLSFQSANWLVEKTW